MLNELEKIIDDLVSTDGQSLDFVDARDNAVAFLVKLEPSGNDELVKELNLELEFSKPKLVGCTQTGGRLKRAIAALELPQQPEKFDVLGYIKNGGEVATTSYGIGHHNSYRFRLLTQIGSDAEKYIVQNYLYDEWGNNKQEDHKTFNQLLLSGELKPYTPEPEIEGGWWMCKYNETENPYFIHKGRCYDRPSAVIDGSGFSVSVSGIEPIYKIEAPREIRKEGV